MILRTTRTLAVVLGVVGAGCRPVSAHTFCPSAGSVSEVRASTPPPAFDIFDAPIEHFTVAQAALSWCGPQLHLLGTLFFFTDPAGMSPERFLAAPSPHPDDERSEDLHRNEAVTWRGYEVRMSPEEFRRAIQQARPFLESQRSTRRPHWVLTVALVVDDAVWIKSFTYGYSFELHHILYQALSPDNVVGRETIAAQRRQIDGQGTN